MNERKKVRNWKKCDAKKIIPEKERERDRENEKEGEREVSF